MGRADIISKMNEYILVKENRVVEKRIKIVNITFTNVRDRLIGMGKILEENFEDTYYIVNVLAGVAKQNSAIVFVKWTNESLTLWAYAKEGLINQHTADDAIERMIKRILQ